MLAGVEGHTGTARVLRMTFTIWVVKPVGAVTSRIWRVGGELVRAEVVAMEECISVLGDLHDKPLLGSFLIMHTLHLPAKFRPQPLNSDPCSRFRGPAAPRHARVEPLRGSARRSQPAPPVTPYAASPSYRPTSGGGWPAFRR